MAVQPSYGQVAAVGGVNSPTTSLGAESPIFTARVISIVLDDTHPRYIDLQGPLGIGSIEIEIVDPPSNSAQNSKTLVAKPLFPNLTNYPIENELVICVKAPSRYSQQVTSNLDNYYFPPINMWNTNHLNALPNSITNKPIQSDNIVHGDFEIENGAVNIIEDNLQPTDPKPASITFPEKDNIKPLLMFEGDVIYQGRWGNSIRFGSTYKNVTTNPKFQNSWSSVGDLGSPITIIRNGQKWTDQEYGFITEDINRDYSSVWLTSNQQLPNLSLAEETYNYYDKVITLPSLYTGAQAIITSGRIILNAKTDNVLISADKSIALNSNEDLSVYVKGSTIINSSTIKLGNKFANEPVLLGNQVVLSLDNLLRALLTLIEPLTNLDTFIENTDGIVKAVPNNSVQVSAKNAKEIINLLRSNLESLKSQNVKTI